MSVTLLSLRHGEDLALQRGVVESATGADEGHPPAVTARPGLLLAVKPGPELFLHYQNANPERGATGEVVILGYAVAPRANRGDLGQFLLDAWKGEGTRFLAGLEGSFSLIMHDETARSCLVATDPLSSRPLWIAGIAAGSAVSSELSIITRLVGSGRAIDRAYLFSYFSWAATVAERSPLQGVTGVEPGQVIEFSDGAPASRSYYVEPLFSPDHRPIREKAGELVEGLRSTLSEFSSGSRSACLFLSGGLDSRLIAALSPQGVTALTLCDRVNAEVNIAGKIAKRCGLGHNIIERHLDWYPSLVEKASRASAGMWSWEEAHFTPLAEMRERFPHDVAILGFGADTYFKGLCLKEKELLRGPENSKGLMGLPEELVRLLMARRSATVAGPMVLREEVRNECREAYAAAARVEVERCLQWAETLPDLWELYLTRGLTRARCMLNLVCLRGFTSERSVFLSPRLRRYYLTLPYQIRQGGRLIVEALKLVDTRLAWLPNSSTWMPAAFPARLHELALRCRGDVSRIRGAILKNSSSSDVSGHCAWQRLDRLLETNARLRGIVTSAIEDEGALPDEIFDREYLRRLWRGELMTPGAAHVDLALLTSFAIFYRNWKRN